MAKYEFKVGDRVQFKEWDEMEKEYGGRTDGINTTCAFLEPMRHLCGTYATIKDFICLSRKLSLVVLDNCTATGDLRWNITADMLKPASAQKPKTKPQNKYDNKPITYPTITAHLIEGKKTYVMLSDGRIGEATCYYKDTFDPAVGVAEAYKKALGITKAEDKPKPKFEIGKKYVLPAVQGGRKKVVIEISNIDDRTGVYTYRIFDHDVYLSFRENGEFYNALIPYTDATVKEAKREAHIGEYVKVVDANLNFGYRNGDILKVILKTFNAIVADSKGEGVTLWKGEYVVLEGYDPDIHGKI